ncbi:hypothetical protein JW933_08095, partial [candidate division FCPU426 bacterium]|nr:hypothetical protein [candidate division FCPU426 bacterium]
YCYFFAAEAAYPMAAVRRRPSPNIRLPSVFQRFQIVNHCGPNYANTAEGVLVLPIIYPVRAAGFPAGAHILIIIASFQILIWTPVVVNIKMLWGIQVDKRIQRFYNLSNYATGDFLKSLEIKAFYYISRRLEQWRAF